MKRVLIAVLSAALAAGVMLQAPQRVFAAANDIYVGGNDNTTAASSCADPDFSTDLSDEGDINSALDAALAAVDDDGDTIIICDGEYEYQDDIGEHDGGVDWAVITIQAADGAEVTLDGDESYQLFNFIDMETVSISGIAFVDAQVTGSGAAIYFEGNPLAGDGLIVSDCSFTDGLATEYGGAIYLFEGAATISGTSFQSNTTNGSDYGGGAIYAEEANITIEFTEFRGNSADWGGAVVFDDADAIVTSGTFINNFTTYESDDMAAAYGGGALYLYGGTLEVNESSFVGNSTPGTSAGAGIHVYAGSLNVDDSIFRGNRAGQGPAIYSYGSGLDDDWDDGEEIVITGSVFRANANVALDDSGAIAHERNGRDFVVTGNSFASNSGATFGGAIETWLVDGLTEITGNVFTGNSAREGGALWIDVRNGVADIHSNRFNRNRARTGGAISFECETDAPRTVTRLLSRSNRYSSNTANAPRSSANVWSSRYVDSAEDCN